MKLQNELELLKSYFGTDVNAFKNQYKIIKENFTSDNDTEAIDEYIDNLVAESSKEGEQQLEEIELRYKLIINKDIIPFSYIAKNYFQKSRGWLQQKINGNVKNGKPAQFTADEIKTLNFALQDISKRLDSITS